MTLKPSLHRWTLATLLVAVSAATFAPAAFADQGWRRYKHDGRAPWGYAAQGYRNDWRGSRVVYRNGYHGGGVPLVAGLVGGMLLGSMLESHAQPVVVHDSYCPPPRIVEHVHYYSQPQVIYRDRDESYQDAPQVTDPEREATPYLVSGTVYRFEDGNGERWWDTLDECTDAARNSGGPHVIKVVEDRTNQLVVTLYWSRDHWITDQNR